MKKHEFTNEHGEKMIVWIEENGKVMVLHEDISDAPFEYKTPMDERMNFISSLEKGGDINRAAAKLLEGTLGSGYILSQSEVDFINQVIAQESKQ